MHNFMINYQCPHAAIIYFGPLSDILVSLYSFQLFDTDILFTVRDRAICKLVSVYCEPVMQEMTI